MGIRSLYAICLYLSVLFVMLAPPVYPASPTTPWRIRSYEAQRWQGVVRQQSDITCGAAALATVLNLYGRATTEADVLATLYPMDDVPITGLSVYDITRGATALGVRAVALRMHEGALQQFLARERLPVIVHLLLEPAHFSVAVGIAQEHVILADPTLGTITMHWERFERQWNRVAIVVLPSQSPDLEDSTEHLRRSTARLSLLNGVVRQRLAGWSR